ncbi:MAG: glycoside hydrolase [Bacteroidales bacterium]|nr:glycoside hydrolase [Bacteroidales bacterium]
MNTVLKLIYVHLIFFYTINSHAQLAQGSEKFIGNIMKGSTASDVYFTLYWNQLTPENSGKWKSVEPTRDVMDWSRLDEMYDYAQKHGFPVKQHTFVWGQAQPDWITGLSAADQKAEVEEWMQLFCGRYASKTQWIDVVNEPLHAPPPYKDAIGGDGATGWDWVVWSFEKARLYAPDAELILNDYDILKSSTNTNNFIAIINLLKDSGLIDGIGLQAHFLESTGADIVKVNLDKLAETGLPIYISELDIDNANDTQQKDKYAELFPVLWEHPAVKGITFWGYGEGKMWRKQGYLIRSDGSERPAMTWLESYLGVDISPNDQTAYTNHNIPGTIQAEAYDTGANKIAFYDTDDGDHDACGRNDDVDIETSAGAGQGCNVFNVVSGEWLEYSLNEVTAGTYDIHIQMASETDGNTIRARIGNGYNYTLLGEIDCPTESTGFRTGKLL